MKTEFFEKDFLEFFKELSRNNNKDWFDQHRSRYENSVKKPFEKFIGVVLDHLGKQNPSYLQLKSSDCIFKINKDIRFSKDKEPYKLNRSALIAPEGRKATNKAGFYFEIGPGTCICHAGVYQPEKEHLQLIRNRIANNSKLFYSIIENREFQKNWGSVHGNKNKRLDKELQAAAEKNPILYNNQFIVTHTFEPKEILKNTFLEFILNQFQTAVDFNQFLSQS